MTETTQDKELFSITNDKYELDKSKTPMWYVFTGEQPHHDGQDFEQYMVVIGPSTETPDEVRAFMAKNTDDEDSIPFEYRGGFDHEPDDDEKKQFFPEGHVEK